MENIKVYGLDESIKASKYPMSTNTVTLTDEVTPTVLSIGNSKAGLGHDQFLTGILVSFDLEASIKMWVELQRYHFVEFVSSQSTMHRVTKMNFGGQCNDYVWEETINRMNGRIEEYNKIKDKGSQAATDLYLEILYNVPTGFGLTARLTTNYRQLKTIYHQRRNHKLPEWRRFCGEIEDLPKFKELCLVGEKI